ncbi:hypothetical protein HDU67_000732 [Dinochytrium kinnereticum]|nr:hypothetical protein HDU67_000732 [Dinochytrium kinnereticum]
MEMPHLFQGTVTFDLPPPPPALSNAYNFPPVQASIHSSIQSLIKHNSDDELVQRFKKLTGHEPIAYATSNPFSTAPDIKGDDADQLLAAALTAIKTQPPSSTPPPSHDPKELDIPVPSTPIPDIASPTLPTFVDYTELVLTSPSKVFTVSDAASRQRKPFPFGVDDSDVESLIEAVSREVWIEKKFGAGTAVAAEVGLEERLKHLREFVPPSPSSSSSSSKPPQLQPSRAQNSNAASVPTKTAQQPQASPPPTRVTPPATPASSAQRKQVLSPLGAPPPVTSLEELIHGQSGRDGARGTEEEEVGCCICERKGILRCPGCDGDAYCVRCWKNGHVGSGDPELERHVAVKISRRD